MITNWRGCLCGLLLCVLSAVPGRTSAQTFASTMSGSIGSVDPVWTVAAKYGAYGAGFAGFGGTFGAAYHYADYPEYSPVFPFFTNPGPGLLAFIANTPTGNNLSPLSADEPYIFLTFRQRFDLTGFDPLSAMLQFRWACDDVPSPGGSQWTPAFSLNGGTLQGANTCGGYALGSTVSLSDGFVAGENYLDFFVQGNSITDGFSLQTVAFTANPLPVPETGSALLLATGVAGLAGIARYRHRR